MHGFITDIGIAIVAATVLGIVAFRLKQPIILAYLFAGALIGPNIGLKLITDPYSIEIISEIGLILLLFIIGLEMDIHTIVSSGRQLLVTGIGQFLFCSGLGLGFFMLIKYQLNPADLSALYLALACALSSTAIVIKLLYDKLELDCLHGKITLGILIIQDLWAIAILAFQPNFMNPKVALFLMALVKSAFLLAGGFLVSKLVLQYVCRMLSKSPEMIVAVSIGWCALVAGTADMIGLSKEMGALIAGVSISTFPYSVHITAKTLPLRDFFLTLFFISLGMKISAPTPEVLLMASVIVVFVILSRFATIYPLLSITGAGRRTAFITSLNLSQISEFSLVVASLGVVYGHIRADMMSLLTYAMAFTSVISSYLIKYNHEIYLQLERLIAVFKPCDSLTGDKETCDVVPTYPIMILGYHRGAQSLIKVIAEKFPGLLNQILVIDFNLESLRELKKLGIEGVFGDISSVDTLEHAHIREAEVILSTIPDILLKGTTNAELVKTCRLLAPDAFIIATADFQDHADRMKEEGADEVLVPYCMTGEALADMLRSRKDVSSAG
ncbi:MAG: cation:proton antiporter [Endomicrobiales bacterium]|nr:cation:proton antiporter [Endomicrobiales bacterium]